MAYSKEDRVIIMKEFTEMNRLIKKIQQYKTSLPEETLVDFDKNINALKQKYNMLFGEYASEKLEAEKMEEFKEQLDFYDNEFSKIVEKKQEEKKNESEDEKKNESEDEKKNESEDEKKNESSNSEYTYSPEPSKSGNKYSLKSDSEKSNNKYHLKDENQKPNNKYSLKNDQDTIEEKKERIRRNFENIKKAGEAAIEKINNNEKNNENNNVLPFEKRPVVEEPTEEENNEIVDEAASVAAIDDVRIVRGSKFRKFNPLAIPGKLLTGVQFLAHKVVSSFTQEQEQVNTPVVTKLEKYDYELHEMQRKEAFERKSKLTRLKELKELRNKLKQQQIERQQANTLDEKTSKSFGHIDLIYLSILLMLLIFIIGIMIS